MALITDILNTIKNARKGKDMRQAIYDGIRQCYNDATGHPESVAATVKEIGEVSANLSKETADRKAEVNTERKRIDNLIKELPATAGEYQQSKLVLHGYDNTAVKCTTISRNYTNVPAFTTDQGGPLSSLYTKKTNYQIAVNKSGLYLFELRIHVNSLIANKRVELAPFVNDTRNAALASSYNTAGNFTLIQVAALPLWLSANDTVDFRIAPIDAAEVSLQLGDVLVYAIDWEDKFKIPDYTGYAAETKDIRTGADGTVYGTAGEAVRKQIGNITEELDTQKNFLVFPVNMLNPESFTIGYVINNTDGSLLAHNRYSVSDFVEVHKGAVYTGKHAYSYYGQNLKIIYYNSDKKFVETKAPESVDSTNGIVKFTAIMNGYVRVVVATSSISDSMFVNSDAYPSKYLEYSKKILKQDVVVDGQNVKNISKTVSAELTRLEIGAFKNRIIENEIKILDNYLRADGTISTGAYCAEITDIKTNEIYHIKCKSGSAVRPYVVKNSAGAIVRYFASEEAWNTQHDYDVTITISAKENGGTLIINSIAKDYIGVKHEENRFLINGERIEEKSISLSKLEKTDNVLFQKIAIFDGDSICHGTSVGSSDPTYGQGWAGRIGKLNNMNYKNYGISGGVITSNDAFEDIDLHSVVDNIDNMYNDYPDADYIIFEGGTNDADRLGVFTDNSKVGTLDITDFSGNYDVKTFTGALETIFFKATKYWSGKHIGYIVAQKMGYGSKQYDKEHSNRRAYFERAIEVCEKWGIPYKDLWNDCYLNPKNPNMYTYGKTADENIALGNLYVDGQHLSAGGYDYISPIIEGWMKTI